MATSIGVTAQTPRTFDAASVRRNPGNRGAMVVAITGDRLSAPFVTLRELVRVAYGVDEHQVVGGPGWLDTDRFAVEAKIPPGASPEAAREMLRALLTDRFGLAVHTETRDLPIYALLFTGKFGPGMRVSGLKCAPLSAPPGLPPPPPPPAPPAGAAPMLVLGRKPGDSKCPTAIVRGFITARDMTVASFAEILMPELRRQVVDRTQLTGHYDIDLSYLPDSGPLMVNGTAINADGPSLTTAVREQLGLRLDSEHAPTEVIVIDRATAPTEN
jgi:uncharacterized protein (TIGR03435 family)